MNRLIGDRRGSSLVEFTLVFPVLALVALGTVDVSYMLYEWSLANKAAYRGVRLAVVSDPVAGDITGLNTNDPSYIGALCFDPATGSAVSPAVCPTFDYACGSVDTKACPGYDAAAFTAIYDRMHEVFRRLQPANVEIRYQTTGLGFAGRPGGLPLTVTVSIVCMKHEFYSLGAFMRFFTGSFAYPAMPAGCPANTADGYPLPAFATSLPSEDLTTIED